MFEHIRDAFFKHGRRLFRDDRFETLWKVFERMIRDTKLQSVTCIIDGLDECLETELEGFWIKIRALFSESKLSTVPKSGLRLILTSRNSPDSFDHHLHIFTRLRLDSDYRKEIESDVERYIDTRMEELECARRLKPTVSFNTLRHNVRRKLMTGANGTYLWVRFAINMLKGHKCPDIENELDKYPSGLDGMYRKMFIGIWPQKKDIVIKMLQWTLGATRPLTLIELGTAADVPSATGQSLDDAVADYVSYCRDLLTVADSTPKSSQLSDDDDVEREEKLMLRTVVPVHASLKDFVRGIKANDVELSQFYFSTFKCHRKLAAKTLDCTLQAIEAEDDEVIGCTEKNTSFYKPYTRHPLLEYSLSSALQHYMKSRRKKEKLDFSHRLFNVHDPVHIKWLRSQSFFPGLLSTPVKLTFLHVAALLGHVTITEVLVASAVGGHFAINQIDVHDQWGRTPLFYAALRGHLDVANFLLKNGAKINARDCIGQSPLHIACSTENEDMVSLLLQAGASVNCPSTTLASRNSATEGEGEVVSMLDDDRMEDDEGYDVGHSKYFSSGTPLHIAAAYNQVAVMRVLLSEGEEVNANAQDDNGDTPLHRALASIVDNSEMCQVLIDGGTNLSLTNHEGHYPIHIAAENDDCAGAKDYNSPIKQLLRSGVHIDQMTQAQGNHHGGMTALQIASREAYLGTIEYLLENGANVDHKDNRGRTALHWACSKPSDISQSRAAIASRLIQAMEESTIFRTDTEQRSAHDIALETDKQYEQNLERAQNRSPLSRNLAMIWGTAPGHQPVAGVIQNAMTLIQLPMTEEQEKEKMFVQGRRGEDGTIVEAWMSKRRAYRDRMRDN
ncbi:ankyrin repeat-containing domain protein [Lophiotrema nucula]|uniref:Ankyrin repeat-containing domain protein n=1 Tax=Lophiotrema nucula TaxID=690887 RepID=A0A6A5YTK1_9PLEO|nr:ankyrin repeat-containing domain protein [Lophiotrema nucula]